MIVLEYGTCTLYAFEFRCLLACRIGINCGIPFDATRPWCNLYNMQSLIAFPLLFPSALFPLLSALLVYGVHLFVASHCILFDIMLTRRNDSPIGQSISQLQYCRKQIGQVVSVLDLYSRVQVLHLTTNLVNA